MRWVALAAVVLLSGCVALEKGAEANTPTVTCFLIFGDGCRFDSAKDLDKTISEDIDDHGIEVLPFPPIGQHAVE